MKVLEEVSQSNFSFSIIPSSSSVSVFVDGTAFVKSGCAGLSCTGLSLLASDWVMIALTVISTTSDKLYFQIFCDYVMTNKHIPENPISFPLTQFRIGEGFIGQIREFKVFAIPLGDETLTHHTSGTPAFIIQIVP